MSTTEILTEDAPAEVSLKAVNKILKAPWWSRGSLSPHCGPKSEPQPLKASNSLFHIVKKLIF